MGKPRGLTNGMTGRQHVRQCVGAEFGWKQHANGRQKLLHRHHGAELFLTSPEHDRGGADCDVL